MSAVRRAEPSDLPSLLPLTREFCEADQHDYDEARIVRALAPLLHDDTHGQVWVVTSPSDPSALSGYAVVTWGWSLESGGREALLDEIYVRDRGNGVGEVLLRHAMGAAAAASASTMFLETEAHNARVRRFYARLGFAEESSVWMSGALSLPAS
ncbi:GNAT family N-acetyltransferase [Dactylosporangium sp. AC04546]|uniref:GNAT family N-acetyltransferase n=1 Tax=Dactylosporangium sp. AC04546 TaxID=2862460 RepID=UPI001EE0006F|nr:GNAT family N-acetyltransferase [Dactylosporangium sp. AC04546]WVK87965.1 GNAT family N-acetyltransferase [Dactylosporangium sp. AC04546]